MRSTFWHFALGACSAAAWVLIPLSLASVWLARKARDGESRADIELLRARALRRAQQRAGARR